MMVFVAKFQCAPDILEIHAVEEDCIPAIVSPTYARFFAQVDVSASFV